MRALSFVLLFSLSFFVSAKVAHEKSVHVNLKQHAVKSSSSKGDESDLPSTDGINVSSHNALYRDYIPATIEDANFSL